MCGVGCSHEWRGIDPVFDWISLENQVARATVLVFADPVQSRSLAHKESVPASINAGSQKEQVLCEAYEETLRVRQVFKESIKPGEDIRIET